MGYFGIFWTQKAFDKEFFGPLYKEVLEMFNNLLPEGGNARNVLDKLKERFSINRIHDSLIDLLEHEYPFVRLSRAFSVVLMPVPTDIIKAFMRFHNYFKG